MVANCVLEKPFSNPYLFLIKLKTYSVGTYIQMNEFRANKNFIRVLHGSVILNKLTSIFLHPKF